MNFQECRTSVTLRFRVRLSMWLAKQYTQHLFTLLILLLMKLMRHTH